MSNKAIVFYTGELLEAQENSLREAHGVENIIFVPIEDLGDLETKILETTEQPFTVYNYLTDPELAIAVCDKLSSFTAETGFLPEYFIWVDEIKTNHCEENSKVPTNTSRVIIITEKTLAKSLNLKKEEVNDKVDVISINIPAISEENVKQVFNDKMFRGCTKPTFVLIDDRHKYAGVVADLVKAQNVYKNINVKIIDMCDHSLMEILKKQADLEVKERFEEMKATRIASLETQYNKPDDLHGDLLNKPLTPSMQSLGAVTVNTNIPIGIDVSGGAAQQSIGRLKRGPIIPRLTNPDNFMISGVALSDDVMFGYEFDDEPNCFIYTSSEKNLLSWFNAFIKNLANSKREFPLLKAVIYAFGDERNQPMLGDDRDHNFVSRRIFAALELFGNTDGIKIFKPNEIEEFKQYIALTDEENSQRTELMAQVHSPGVLHIDVSGTPMPPSISRIKDNVEKFAEMQKRKDDKALMVDYDPKAERPDPYLSYGEAIEMCKRGIDVACVNWRADEFLTVNSGVMVHADNFWSPGNKRMAMANPDQSLSVFPHFLRTTKYGTAPYVPDFNDMFSEWAVATDRVKVKSAKIVKEDLYERLVLDFGLDTHTTADFELAPFWIVYDVLVKNPFSVTVISGTDQTNLPQIIGAIKSTYDQRQNITQHAWMLNESGYISEHPMPEAHIYHYVLHNVNSTVERILRGEFSCVIVDVDSFSSHLELSTVKHALKEAGMEWAAVSVKEQLQN